MNWKKVAVVVIGGVVVFFVVDSLIHVVLGLISALAFVALVGGGIYAVGKLVGGARKTRELPESHEPEQPYRRTAPPAPKPAATHDVEADLARLKREMGG